MADPPPILITGAAGNLGGLLAHHLMARTAGTNTTPIVLRLGMVYGRGILMIVATIGRTGAPSTRDFVRRARQELIPDLIHPDLASGRSTL